MRTLADALLGGRQTFTDLRGCRRDLADCTTGVSDHLNGVQKYVVSSTLDDPGRDRTTVLRGDPVAAVRGLKEQLGRDIVLTGSISLAHALSGPASWTSAARLPRLTAAQRWRAFDDSCHLSLASRPA